MNGDDRDGERSEVIDQRGALIESKINMERASTIGVALGGLNTSDMAQVLEYAKGMALSGPMVPAFCRNQVWTCFGICVQAIEWQMSPFSLARMAYAVENTRTREITVSYMSQVHHAVLESRAPLKERLKVRYEGEGDDTVCVVSGVFKGETEPREWKSPRLGDRRPKPQTRKNRQTGEEYTTTSGSPLWESKPLVQLFYDTSRDWARIYCPDVTLGLYSRDEMEDAGFSDTGPPRGEPDDDGGLGARLTSSALARAGFPAEAAAATIDAELAKRNNGGGSALKPPSVDPGAAEATPAEGAAPPSEPYGEAMAKPSGAPETAEEPPPVSEHPETDQSRPRPARSRRRPPGEDAGRLV
jgi:hypothetical protein